MNRPWTTGAIVGGTGRSAIRTSFGMKEGETIVVGTSKLDGGQEALVLLLAAVLERGWG